MEIALPLAAASGASIFLYKKVIPARVECWFCSTKQWVRRSNANSFFCRQCTQYNGFTADGDYNRRVPGQHNWTLKTPTYCVRQRSARPDVVPTRATNGLCDKCNNAQELILQRVANFEASNEETWADELEDYKHRLEKAYPLCEKCVFALRKKLDEDKMKYGYLVNAKRFLVEGTVRLVNPLMPTKRKRFFVAGGRTVFFQVLGLFFPLLLLSTFFHRIRQTSPLFDSPPFSPIADAFVDAVEINSVTIALLAFVAHFLGVWYSKARVTFCDLLFPVIALALAVVNNYNFDWSNEDRLMSQFALSGALFVVATAVLFIPQKLKHKKRPNTISSAFSVASTPMSQLSRSTISETSPLATTKFSPEPTISSSRTQETPSIFSQRTTSDSTRRPHAMAASPFTRFRGRSRESTPAFAGGGVSDSSMEWEDSVFEMNSRMTGRRVEPQQTIMTRSAAFREARKGREETPVTSRLASVFGGLDLDSSSDDDYRSTMTVKSKRSHISSPLNGHQNRVFPQPPPSVLSTTFTELSKRRAGVSKTPSPFSRAQSVYSVSQTLGAGSSASSMMTVATTQALEQNYRWIKALVGVVVLLLLVNVVQLYINFKP